MDLVLRTYCGCCVIKRNQTIYAILIICLQMVKWLQVFLFYTNWSFEHFSLIYSLSNGPKHCYVIPIIQFRHTLHEFKVLLFSPNYSMLHFSFVMHTVKWFRVFLCITNNSMKHQSFAYAELNDKTVLFLTIKFNISHLFALSLNYKQFYLTHRKDTIRCYDTGP